MLINFQLLGCRLNEAEVEQWANQFMQRGHEITTEAEEADVVVFNSCAVTAEADRKSRQQIGRLQRKNPEASLVVTGCHASLNPQTVKNYPGVDLVIGNAAKEQLVEQTLDLAAARGAAAGGTEIEPADSLNALLLRGRHRGFIKIQDGCRYRCTYCIVTLARGDEHSRPEADIIGEIDRLHAQGVQEVALTGVHVGGYGSDIDSSLYRLLGEILERTEIPRIRLASVEPWDLPDQFFSLFQDRRLMPHMHLPLQSGCDTVLRRMARRCKTAEFARLADRARSEVPLFNITTDVIAGFPGETEREWQETLKFVERVGFGHMHIFPFSARDGTKAARLSDQVDVLTRKRRVRELHSLALSLKRRELQRHLGGTASVMWEQQINTALGQWVGYTQHYHKITRIDPDLSAARIETTTIDDLSGDGTMLVSQAPQISVAGIGHGGKN